MTDNRQQADFPYKELVKVYKQLEATTKKTLMTAIVARLLKSVPPAALEETVKLLIGKIFAEWEDKELGVGEKLVLRAISIASGIPKNELEKIWVKLGDLGDTAAYALRQRRQIVLFREKLTVKKVYYTLRKVAEIQGEGSIDKKVRLIANLLVSADPDEGKYLVRTILEELRVGVGEGILRDAIAKAFNVPDELVERAYYLTCDFGLVARIAAEKGVEGLKQVDIEPGRPIKVMLAQAAADIPEAFSIVGSPAAVEIKYDGARLQIHKIGDKVILYTRHLKDVTKQFPEVVEYAKKYLKCKTCVVEGETVAWDFEKDRPKPFQVLSRRIQRKYDIYKMMKEIPTKTFLFDIVYVDGKNLMDLPYEERHKVLEQIVEEHENFRLADRIITSSYEEAEKFYNRALELGHEGVMFKNLKAKYQPGKRVGYMVKLKPVMETLDCVIVAAEWGEGRRAQFLSSYYIAVRDPDTGRFLTIGKMGSGMTDEELEELTKRLKELIIKEEGKKVYVKPQIVVEVAFQEIEKSPRYESGFALRFPRLVRIREDKGPEEADTIHRLKELWEKFAKRKGELK